MHRAMNDTSRANRICCLTNTSRRHNVLSAVFCILVTAIGASATAEDLSSPASNEDESGATVGTRPYEMDWAGRNRPAHEQSVDFEDLTGWRVRRIEGAEASAYRSRQERLFGDHTAKVVYSGVSKQSGFVLEPPTPIAIDPTVDAVTLWVRGNTWGWMHPPKTPPTEASLLLRDRAGRLYRIKMGTIDFDYWSLLYAPLLSPDGRTPRYEPLGQPSDAAAELPISFAGIEVTGCASKEPARLYFDALSFYKKASTALAFDAPAAPFDWLTTPDTILPTVKGRSGPDPTFRYVPSDGTLGDLQVTIDGCAFQPCLKGGLRFEVNGRVLLTGDREFTPCFVGTSRDGGKNRYEWELAVGGVVLRYTFSIETKGKSCIIDVTANGGGAVQFDIGLEKGLPGARTIQIPYLTYSWDGWPRMICGNGASGPVFLLALMDPYNSDASELFGPADLTAPEALGYTGGSRYRPTTAGVRNAVRERVFINVSTDVHEVLPNIPNPVSDIGLTTRQYVCNNLGEGSYPFPYELLRKYKAYGIDKYLVNHHECLWRRGCESYTLRDQPAPEIGQQPLIDYGAFVRGLGYRFGLYQNFTDLAPVSAAWDEDLVCLNSDGTWKNAWPRTYALKPSRSVALQALYGTRVHERYGTTASCIDVHTALTPWERTDYDARTPGAGKFSPQFDAYGHVLANESRIHGGPTFSEGNYHWFYAGLSSGNYATILPFGTGYETPPLVDFDLLKMHPKMTDLGMGSPFCFFGYKGEWNSGASRLSQSFDRYLTSTIAYGHIGYLAEPWGFDGTLKSYYLMQALQQRYAMVPVSSIQYFDGAKLLGASEAIATDAYKRGQIRTEYENGLITWCNLSTADEWTVTLEARVYLLPPASFLAYRPNDILEYSATIGGVRHEAVICRDYLYLDSRDAAVAIPPISGRGAVAVKPNGPNAWWIIPATKAQDVTLSLTWLGVAGNTPLRANAYDETGHELGPLELTITADSVTVTFPNSGDTPKCRFTAGIEK